MRLIDADALANRIIDAPTKRHDLTGEVITNSMLWYLHQAPTIEPERKKGKWLHKSKQLAALNTAWWYECSICGYHAFNGMRTDFCPNCGADMRGNEDD